VRRPFHTLAQPGGPACPHRLQAGAPAS
jgi:hypothetical protein